MSITTHTNIEIDDDLIATAMQKYELRTEQEAIDLALRRLVGPQLTMLSPSFLAGLQGIGWEVDLDEMRESRSYDWD